MIDVFFASLVFSRFSQVLHSWRSPTRCPYCANSACHWIKWASYERWGAGIDEKIRVPRFFCKITRRTFSILPDALLPFHHHTTATIIRWLMETFVEERTIVSVARRDGVHPITIQRIRAKFVLAVNLLRLSGHEGALAPDAFLEKIAALGIDAAPDLFASWKEMEPKLSIVGVHPR